MKLSLLAMLLSSQFLAGPAFVPARAVAAVPPVQAAMVIGGGEVLLEVYVDPTGAITRIKPLRTTAPFTALMMDALKSWRFSSATMAIASARPRPVDSSILVAGMFRPPALYSGSTAGEVPRDVAPPSQEIPVPGRTVMPAYPPQAVFDGVVVIEVAIAAEGAVKDLRVISSGAGFDQAALDAARQWTFRPASRNGQPVSSFAYLMFGFRQPVTAPGRR